MDRADVEPDNKALSPMVSVDVPEPEWSRIKFMEVDRNKLEGALSHGSLWLAMASANLISGLNYMSAVDVATLLAGVKGYALAAAAYFAGELRVQSATELLLARLQGPVVPGLQYIFITLKDLEGPWTDSLANGVRTGLMASSVRVAEEAAKLTLKYAEQCVPVPTTMLEDAFEYWLVNEAPYPKKSGAILGSPRETLLKVLLLMGVVTDDRLIHLSNDARSDVRRVTDRALTERANASSDTRAAYVSATLDGKLSHPSWPALFRQRPRSLPPKSNGFDLCSMPMVPSGDSPHPSCSILSISLKTKSVRKLRNWPTTQNWRSEKQHSVFSLMSANRPLEKTASLPESPLKFILVQQQML